MNFWGVLWIVLRMFLTIEVWLLYYIYYTYSLQNSHVKTATFKTMSRIWKYLNFHIWGFHVDFRKCIPKWYFGTFIFIFRISPPHFQKNAKELGNGWTISKKSSKKKSREISLQVDQVVLSMEFHGVVFFANKSRGRIYPLSKKTQHSNMFHTSIEDVSCLFSTASFEGPQMASLQAVSCHFV